MARQSEREREREASLKAIDQRPARETTRLGQSKCNNERMRHGDARLPITDQYQYTRNGPMKIIITRCAKNNSTFSLSRALSVDFLRFNDVREI